MKKTLILSCLITASAAVWATAADPAAQPLPGVPKNLARQNLGANLFQYQPSTQAYTPTQASAAWLDDDISTGWPAMAGQQYYLLALPDSEVLTNFCLSARPASGTISLYVGDEPAPPTAKSWTQVAKDVPLEAVNEKKLAHPFSRAAKYLLIETSMADPGPIYSLYLYGDKAASSFAIHNRQQPIDTHAIFGAYVNDSTSFNVTSLYAQSMVKQADGSVSVAGQAAIDDNPETAVTLGGASNASNLTVSLGAPRNISRVAVEVDPGTKGRLDFFVTDDKEQETTPAPEATIVLDGTNARASVDFAGVNGTALKTVWTPANGTDSVGLHELNAFSGLSLAANAVVPVDADGQVSDRVAARSRSDGKDPKAIAERDGKDGKSDAPAGIGELDRGPYLPGALGFPPNLTNNKFKIPPPLGPKFPVSP